MGIGQTMDAQNHIRRFHLPHAHLESAFGSDWFGKKAENFARFFGTPTFLVAQTIIVGLWILVNAAGWTQFDVYPFILLNLAFSTQAAYAAPLILLAQTRQADRDKAHSLADAQHREELHLVNEERQAQMQKQTALLVDMLKQNTALTENVETLLRQNTELTETVRGLVERIGTMTADMHSRSAPAEQPTIASSGLGSTSR
ncbi:MAG TPA: DUF1003 domain-containing protein [Roseiarcus sp.]|jgi:uncharacterized membrane protein|nr:DUF1003 domain-containing protein [Roseiarcus sp.]